MEVVFIIIMDCEDLVVVVDVDDKVVIYCNWLGLMKGDLVEEVSKGGSIFICIMNLDCVYIRVDGFELILYGCLLLFVCNVGYLMINDVIFDKDGNEVLEGIQDGLFISLIVIYDLNGNISCKNSCIGSVYIVKLKMYGLEEVVFINELFGCVEDVFGLLCNILKVGIMDEECCIIVNLKVCIKVVKDCVVFINIGFFDCIGDEIYIFMEVGVVVCKGVMKLEKWIGVYENNNVDVGLVIGL